MGVHVFRSPKTTSIKPYARVSLSQAPDPPVEYQWEYQVSEYVQANYATSTSVVADSEDPTKLSEVVWMARPVDLYVKGTAGSQGHVLPFSTYWGGGYLRFNVETGLWPETASLQISAGNSSNENLYVAYDNPSVQGVFDRYGIKGSPYNDLFFYPRATGPTFHLRIKNQSVTPAAVCYPYEGSLWDEPLVRGDSVDTPDQTQAGPGGHEPKFRTYAESVNIGRVAATPDPIGQMPFSFYHGDEWNVWVGRRTKRRNATRFGTAALVHANLGNTAGRGVKIRVDVVDWGGSSTRDSTPLVYKVRNSRSAGEYAGEADAISTSTAGTTMYFWFKPGDDVDGVAIAPTHYGSKPSYMLKGHGFTEYHRIHDFESTIRQHGRGGSSYTELYRAPFVKTKVTASFM